MIQYDIPVIERITKLKRNPKQPVDDTLLRSRVLWPESYMSPMKGNDLAAWGKHLGIEKGSFDGPWDVWTQEMEDYCVQDVKVLAAIKKALAKIPQNELVVRVEHEVTKIIARQTANGWTFDNKAAEKLIAELEIARAGVNDELQKAFPPRIETLKTPAYWEGESADYPSVIQCDTKGALEVGIKKLCKAHGFKFAGWVIRPGPMRTKEHPFNPASGMQISDRLTAKYGWVPEEQTPAGEPKTDYDVMVKLPYPEAKLLIAWSDTDTLLEQVIDRFRRTSLNSDGKLHGTINVQGCVTGRMSHNQPNDGNVSKDKRMRKLYGPRPGWKLVGVDAKGLELRMLANRMARFDGGAYGRILLEGDIHIENMKAAGLATKDESKTFIYAFLYGAGDTKIGKVIKKGAKEGKALRTRFLSKLPALQRVIDIAKASARNEKVVTLLDSRQVPCRSEHAALNTQLQGDGAVVMKVALLIVDKKLQALGYVPGQDYEFVGNIHDEYQIECRPEIAEIVAREGTAAITEAGVRLKVVVRLDGDSKIGNNWSETH